MESFDETAINLTVGELALLLEGLNAYEYWQLGDVLPRSDGQVFLPDDPFGDRFWSGGDGPTAEQEEAIEGVRRCRRLMARLREASAAHGDEGDRERFERTRAAHTRAVDALVPALIAYAIAEVDEVLPGTSSLDVLGETTEDGLDTLRIRRVRNADGDVLYDVDGTPGDRAVEDRIDLVGSEYLDQLLDVTYGAYFGPNVLERVTSGERGGGVVGDEAGR
jgi:hypothetical protein